MPLELEDAIHQALDSAGHTLPDPLVDLAGRAKSRHRTRRRNRGVAAFAALALVAGAVYTTGGHHGAPAGPAHFELTSLPLATDEWPDAIRTLPGTLPGGLTYAVIAQIDADTYIVQDSADGPTAGAVYMFEPARNSLHELVAGRVGKSKVATPNQVAQMVDDNRYVVVAKSVPTGSPVDVSVVSVADDRQVNHFVVPAGDPAPATFGWYDGHLVWSADGGSGATDPFSGMHLGIYGPAHFDVPIAGTSTYSIYAPTDPWASSSSETDGEFTLDMWNLRTGRHQHGTAPDDDRHFYYCLSTGCRLSAAQPHAGEVLTIDGTRTNIEYDQLRGHFLVQTALTEAVAGVGVLSPAVTTIWDMADNTYVTLPVVPDASFTLIDEAQLRSASIVALPDEDGHKVILNLAAITD